MVGLGLGALGTVIVTRRTTLRGSRTSSAAAIPSTTGAPRWSEVVDRLSLGVVVTGPTGLVHYRNRAARALEGTHMGVLVDDAVERMLQAAGAGAESRQDL